MNFENITDKELWIIANRLMDNLMDGSTEINHAKHTKDFTSRLQKIVSSESFKTMCESYQRDKGYFSSRKQVAVIKRPSAAAFIWKQSFTKVKGDYVAEMLVVHRNGKFLVEHVMVF